MKLFFVTVIIAIILLSGECAQNCNAASYPENPAIDGRINEIDNNRRSQMSKRFNHDSIIPANGDSNFTLIELLMNSTCYVCNYV